MSALLAEPRHHEQTAVAAYLRTCDEGLAGRYVVARFPGECALTRATIRPGHEIVNIGYATFCRRDAVQLLSIAGKDTVDSVLDRFGWSSPELAAEWLEKGDRALLITAATLKPKLVSLHGRGLGETALSRVTPLYWRSVAFMLRRERGDQ